MNIEKFEKKLKSLFREDAIFYEEIEEAFNELVNVGKDASVYKELLNENLIDFFKWFAQGMEKPLDEVLDYGLLGEEYSTGILICAEKENKEEYNKAKCVSYVLFSSHALTSIIKYEPLLEAELIRGTLKRLFKAEIHPVFKAEILRVSFKEGGIKRPYLFNCELAQDLTTACEGACSLNEIKEYLYEAYLMFY